MDLWGGGIDTECSQDVETKLRPTIYYPEEDCQIREYMRYQYTPMLHSVMLIRRDVLELLAPNYYLRAYNLCPENQLYMRLAKQTRFHNIQKVLGLYRYYSGNSSINQAQEQRRQYYALWNKFKDLI